MSWGVAALKHQYQHYLQHDAADIRYVFLEGSEELIAQRLAARHGHFMNPALLHSQFETLEPPEHALRVNIAPSPAEIAAEIRQKLNLKPVG